MAKRKLSIVSIEPTTSQEHQNNTANASKAENPDGSEFEFELSDGDDEEESDGNDDADGSKLQHFLATLQQNTQKRRTQAYTAAINKYTKNLDATTAALTKEMEDKQKAEVAAFEVKSDKIRDLMLRRKDLVLQLQAVRKEIEEFVKVGRKESKMDVEKVVKEFLEYDKATKKIWLGEK